MTFTVELLREDALDLLQQLERLSILRFKKDKVETPVRIKPNITRLYGTLKLNMSIEEIDNQLKALRNEWERDFF